MCLATPVKIKKIKGNKAEIENGKTIDISLVSDLKSGDYILAHDNLAINKINSKEAKQILKLVKSCHHKHRVKQRG